MHRELPYLCSTSPSLTSRIYKPQSEVHQANTVDKMRDKVIRPRSKNNDLRDETSDLKRQQ
jgi:hypothetical protein